MILAAGRGKRMQSLTDQMPKPLLLIKNQPLIVYHLLNLKKAGIEDIVINLGYLGHKIKDALGNGTEWGVNIEYSPEDPILETGGGIAKALPLLGTDPFIALSSDIFTDFPFERLLFIPEGLVHMVMVDNPPYHPTGDYALLNGKVRETGDSLLNFGGIAVYRPELFIACPKGIFPVSILFKKAILSGMATGEYYQGMWHNLGTPEQLLSLNHS